MASEEGGARQAAATAGTEAASAKTAAPVKDIIFVCTSNTCRSPVAEGLGRVWLAQRCGVLPSTAATATADGDAHAAAAAGGGAGAAPTSSGDIASALLARGYRVFSRGLTDAYEAPGSPASRNSVIAARELGADISAHRSALLTREEAERAAAVVCVSEGHAAAVRRLAPAAEPHVFTLGRDVPDPWHQELPVCECPPALRRTTGPGCVLTRAALRRPSVRARPEQGGAVAAGAAGGAPRPSRSKVAHSARYNQTEPLPCASSDQLELVPTLERCQRFTWSGGRSASSSSPSG